jgi:hypothetical protein
MIGEYFEALVINDKVVAIVCEIRQHFDDGSPDKTFYQYVVSNDSPDFYSAGTWFSPPSVTILRKLTKSESKKYSINYLSKEEIEKRIFGFNQPDIIAGSYKEYIVNGLHQLSSKGMNIEPGIVVLEGFVTKMRNKVIDFAKSMLEENAKKK